MSTAADTVFLFDVDNTLLDNDRIQDDLRGELTRAHGEPACERYWAIFEALRSELGYADYLGALERLRIERLHDPTLLPTANWHVRQWGQAVILSDGDAVFQPRKIARSGLWNAFAGNVLIYVHKENELADVERWHPAAHYVLVDDKARILAAVKAIWGDRVTTVFPKQGHYAVQEPPRDGASVDLTVDRIGDLLGHDLSKPRS
jgi:FMN phosphatase YigB (HAD superfamily)